MSLYLLFIIPLIQSLLLMNNDCINCKHFRKTIYVKSNDNTLKQLPNSIGYCKIGLNINTPPTIKVYTPVEEFRTNKHIDNCGTSAKFYKKI